MIEVYYLILNNKYIFNEKFPKDVLKFNDKRELLQSKIWYIKKRIRYSTNFNDLIKLVDPKLYTKIIPQGLMIFDPPNNIIKNLDNTFDNAYNDLSDLFNNYESFEFLKDKVTNQESRGLCYLFTNFYETVYYNDTMKFLKTTKYNCLYKIIKIYFKYIMKIYNIKNEKDIVNKVQLVLLKYDLKTGIWLHIDNIKRYNQGPIITLNIGPKFYYNDFAPSLLNRDKNPIRIKIDQGSLLITDGSARMEWSHGIPFNVPNDKFKYTIMFKCDNFNPKNVGYNKILDTPIVESSKF